MLAESSIGMRFGRKRVKKLTSLALEWSDGHGVVKSAVVVEIPMVNEHIRNVCLLMHNFERV